MSSGGLRTDSRAALMKGGASGPAILPEPGKSASSLLLQRVTGQKPPRMPMGAPPLPEAEVAALRSWLDEGAPDGSVSAGPTWQSKMALSGPAVPLDEALGHYWTGRGFTPPEQVPDAVYARRVWLDLWGLPPTPEQLDAFLSDKSSDKRRKLVQQLLHTNRRNYGENWVSFWNDLLHNDEGVTYIGERKSITTWLLASLENNKPYNTMVRQLIDPEEGKGSEGFIVGVNWRGDVNASQVPVMQAAQNSSQVFLGVNLKCNSCHDSFISKWKLRDAYGMASFFAEKPLELVRCDAKTGEMSFPRFLFPELGEIPGGNDMTLAERRRVAAELFTKRENGRFPRTFVNRMWQRLLGRGFVEPVDDMDAEPWSPEVLDALSAGFVENGYDIDWLITTILTSRAYNLPIAPVATGQPYVFNGPSARRMTAEQFVDSVSALTGEWRVLTTAKPQPGTYARDWRFKPSSLSSALGRPPRDLAVTERINDPTTLQMLELVNGQTLATLLHDGSRRLLGELPARPPTPLWDSGPVTSGPAKADIDITGLDSIRLLTVDVDSYDPQRIRVGWLNAALQGGRGGSSSTPALKTNGAIQLKDASSSQPALVVPKLPDVQVIRLKQGGFTRFTATVGSDASALGSDIGPKVRFFVFRGDAEPETKSLPGVKGEPPVPASMAAVSKGQPEALVRSLFRYAYSREPSTKERTIALGMLGSPVTSAGLEDLLWSIVLSPEFQYGQ